MPSRRLVGRDLELAMVVDGLLAAATGHPRILLLTGEAGIGKTRLMQEAAAQAGERGFGVAWGFCSPVRGSRLPYAPIVEILSDVGRNVPDLQGLVPATTWSTLGPLRMEPSVSGEDPGLAVTRLFGAVSDMLDALSRHRPTLLVIEDLHWVDPATMDLLAFAARRLRRGRLVLAVTIRRIGSRPRGGDQSAALAELTRLPSVSTIDLGPLPPPAVRELVRSVPDPPDDDRCERITELAQGVPFFALHLARHDTGEIPPQLRDVLLSAIDSVSDEQRSLLVLLAILGTTADQQLLARAVGGSFERLSAATRGLSRQDLVTIDGGAIRLRHALLREVIADDTLPSERVVAHTLAAEALLASPAADQPRLAASLAHHLMQCGRYVEALQYALRGARHAAGLWAYEDARNLYAAIDRLWDLVADGEQVSGASRLTVLSEAAMASRWCGRLDEALRWLDQAETMAKTDVERARLAHLRGQVLWASGNMPASLDSYQRALTLLPPQADDRLRAAVQAASAHGAMATGRAKQAVRTARAAAALAGAAGDERVRLHASITAAVAQAQLGDVDAAVVQLSALLADVRALDDLELILRCYGNLTFALGVGCRYEELAAAAAEGLSVARRYGSVVSLASTLISNQVNALVVLGRWDEAVRVATDALSDVTAAGVAGHLEVLLAEVAVARGDREEADHRLRLAQTSGAQNPYVMSALVIATADQQLWTHDPVAASVSLTAALPTLREQDDMLLLLEACWRGLRAEADVAETTVPHRRAGSSDAEPALLAMARDAATRTTLPVCRSVLLVVEAEAARTSAADTPEQWATAAEANVLLGRRYVQAYCQLRGAAALLRRQARAQALVVLRAAYATATALAARPLATEIETLAQVSGLQLAAADEPGGRTREPVSSPFRLTPREREVLSLLTTGATNRMIARSLFISERTASVHVSNILTKLDVANRTEAARLGLRLNLDSSDGAGR